MLQRLSLVTALLRLLKELLQEVPSFQEKNFLFYTTSQNHPRICNVHYTKRWHPTFTVFEGALRSDCFCSVALHLNLSTSILYLSLNSQDGTRFCIATTLNLLCNASIEQNAVSVFFFKVAAMLNPSTLATKLL